MPVRAPTHLHIPRASWRRPAPPTFEGRPLPYPDEPVFDQGLAFDVETLLGRRQVLRAMGYGALGAGLFSVAACGPFGSTATPGGSLDARPDARSWRRARPGRQND